MIVFQRSQAGFQMIFQGIQAVEDTIVEGFLSKLIPEVLNRIEFGRIGGKGQQTQITRHRKRSALMPTRPIEHHHDTLIGMPSRDLIEKYLHAPPIDLREDQGIEVAVSRRNRCVRISVFLPHQGLAKRP